MRGAPRSPVSCTCSAPIAGSCNSDQIPRGDSSRSSAGRAGVIRRSCSSRQRPRGYSSCSSPGRVGARAVGIEEPRTAHSGSGVLHAGAAPSLIPGRTAMRGSSPLPFHAGAHRSCFSASARLCRPRRAITPTRAIRARRRAGIRAVRRRATRRFHGPWHQSCDLSRSSRGSRGRVGRRDRGVARGSRPVSAFCAARTAPSISRERLRSPRPPHHAYAEPDPARNFQPCVASGSSVAPARCECRSAWISPVSHLLLLLAAGYSQRADWLPARPTYSFAQFKPRRRSRAGHCARLAVVARSCCFSVRELRRARRGRRVDSRHSSLMSRCDSGRHRWGRVEACRRDHSAARGACVALSAGLRRVDHRRHLIPRLASPESASGDESGLQ